MSIERCEKHSRHWDSDYLEQCPVCAIHENEEEEKEIDMPWSGSMERKD